IRRKVAAPLYSLQRGLGACETYGEMIQALFDFISAAGRSDEIAARAADFEKAGDMQQYGVYSSLWDTIVTAMEQFYDVLGAEPATVEEFACHWELMLSQYDIGAIPPVVDAVSCGGITRMLSRDIKCIIVVGATDDALPHMTSAAGALSEYEREELIRLDLPLPSSRRKRMADDIYAVYASLVQASDRIVMTFSDSSASGTQQRPSIYFTRISELFGITPQRIDRRDCKVFSKSTVVELASSAFSETSDPAAIAARRFAEQSGELSGMLEAAVRASMLKRGTMTPKTARRLYGGKVALTASKVEKYYSCRFSYFMRYGLKAEPRTKAALDAPVIGTYMHYILENVTREVGQIGGFARVSDDDVRELAAEYTAKYASNVLLGFEGKPGRFKYLFRRLAEDAELVVLQMAQELRSSDFSPLDFELSFAADGDVIPPEITDGDVTVQINGVVDRVDGWVHNDKLYLRVVDYKTGRKAFSLSDVWYGMGLQMLIYLFALQEKGPARYGKEIVPAGVLYAPAREAYIPAS
ncbi:MAG: PD-(D/E)XK nuclease family protein, partial [Ruminococcus sp.]|nr:PD-(D/E)XK nuclease family protein [Ruminococcus sp.]